MCMHRVDRGHGHLDRRPGAEIFNMSWLIGSFNRSAPGFFQWFISCVIAFVSRLLGAARVDCRRDGTSTSKEQGDGTNTLCGPGTAHSRQKFQEIHAGPQRDERAG